MAMTTGEEITAGLSYYLNQGSSSVVQDPRQRRKAHFFYTKVAHRVWLSAPYWFRKGDGTVSLTNGVGDMPADFSAVGTQGQIYIQGQLYRPLQYRPPDWVKFQIENSPQTGTPWCYTLYDTDSAKRASGIDQILCWPTDNSTLNIRSYDKKMVEMIDHPLGCTAAVGAAGALTGSYAYKITFVTARGETEAGFASNSVTAAAEDIDLSAIPTWWGRTVTSRKIYRNKAADPNVFYLVDTISDNTTTSYADSKVDGSLGAVAPEPADAVSGTEVFPDQFHDSTLYDGLEYLLAKNQGDGRDTGMKMNWDRQVQRQWEEHQQGLNQIQAFPPYPGFITGHPVWGRWSPPS